MRSDLEPTDLTGQVILVTGANSGIGKETALALARFGATVVMTARTRSKGEAAVDEVRRESGSDAVHLGDLDLGSLASIRSFADWFLSSYDRLDVLVNNAGLIISERRETVDGFEEMFGVNHLGHFLLTDLLRDRLVASAPSRVVVVSSVAHRWAPFGLRRDDLQTERHRFTGFGVYGRSKLANVQFARELARRLSGTGVVVNAVHPGSVHSHFGGDGDTGLLGWFMATFGRVMLSTPAQGARMSIRMAASPDPRYASVTGGYFSHGRQWRPSRAARDDDACRWLWSASEALVAPRPEGG